MATPAHASRAPAHRPSRPVKGPLTLALENVARALDDLPVPGMIIGGMAVIAHGVLRTTRDIDATVDAAPLSIADLLERLRRHALLARIDDAAGFAAAYQVLLLRHEPSGIDVDLSLAWLPFELEALAAATRIDVVGTSLRVVRPEDLVVYKFVAFRPQDQQDIERLLALHRSSINLARVRNLAGDIAEALGAPDRLTAFEQIVRRVERE